MANNKRLYIEVVPFITGSLLAFVMDAAARTWTAARAAGKKAISRPPKFILSFTPKLENWQFWAALITLLGFAFTVISTWTSLEATRYAEWTAKKDFLQLCNDETTRTLSQECGRAANFSLPAPPGFSPARRDAFLFPGAIMGDNIEEDTTCDPRTISRDIAKPSLTSTSTVRIILMYLLIWLGVPSGLAKSRWSQWDETEDAEISSQFKASHVRNHGPRWVQR
ncbi:hypothetical protein B0T22DRAFT_438722 [Podospora appendiculata]|uniref:Uncharacterized protein n=1 Tax=Podospora appendiculata TaxID=314037 RepID=A0AAE1CIH5_9PEZI|nr:hypothetical protein B0T22DRAFT_438722 [Podospora appendiculata]